ncbi:hypothetical protein N2152v2_007288 [Parachlorella kessleri]|uniref:C2 domain-containing protein n=1 Tax=Parachlorella kessleri TaxID=3074 RepID=A0A387KYY0_PARKE|nr:C2 domain-containing protein [Parachlorella kessleri]
MANVGDLEVMVMQGVQLKDVEGWGRQDPLVIIEVSGQKMTTKTKTDAGKNPVWNERFRFIQINPTFATEMSVKLMDKNVVSSDTEIGHARVPLINIYSSKNTEELRVPLLSAKGKSAGELQLLVTFKPYAQPAAQQPLVPAPMPVQPAAAPQMQPMPMAAAPPAPAYLPAQPAAGPVYASAPPARAPEYASAPPAQAPVYASAPPPPAQAPAYASAPPAQAPVYASAPPAPMYSSAPPVPVSAPPPMPAPMPMSAPPPAYPPAPAPAPPSYGMPPSAGYPGFPPQQPAYPSQAAYPPVTSFPPGPYDAPMGYPGANIPSNGYPPASF